MQEYQVTVTYLVSVNAESESTAEQLALEFVKNGWEPNDVEIEEVQ